MDYEKIKKYLDSLVAEGIPSVDLIISKNHERKFRYTTGFVDSGKSVPVNENQRYLMFSMTKVQTMTAIMQLIEQGKVSYDDKVSKFLPAYENLTVEVPLTEDAKTDALLPEDGHEKSSEAKVVPCSTPLLIKHLVSMQSGLDYELDRPGIVRVLKEKGMKATTRELVDSFVESPLIFVPGTHFNYSLSHDVVAAVIEVVSGMSFSEYLRENIWKPLGMKDTFFAKPMNDDVDRLAQQFIVDDFGKIVPMEQSCNYQLSEAYESGGAGLISCTSDYAILADALSCGGLAENGNRILRPESVDLIKTNLLGEDSRKDIREKMGRVGYGYGCGMQVFMEPELVNSPAPAGIFGWDGAAGSCILMDAASGMSFVFAMHVRNCGKAYDTIHPKLRDMIFS